MSERGRLCRSDTRGTRGRSRRYGSRFLNDRAAAAVSELNACYLGGPTSEDFPCPADVRGVAGRAEWRLPGIRVLAADAYSRAFCGTFRGDAVHVSQNHVLLARSLFALASVARDM